jgi:hypothetical protein
MKAQARFALALLAAISVGADGFWSCGKPVPTGPANPPPPSMITPDPDALPPCPQDPPRDCWLICMSADTPGFSDQCIEGATPGALTAQFEQIVNDKIDQAIAAGVELCAPGALFENVKPCDVGIVPLVDDSEACKPAPPGCALWAPPQP